MVYSLFNQLNSSIARASWLSWKRCDFGSSGTRFKFHHGQLFISVSLFFSKWGQRKISKSFTWTAMVSAHACQWSLEKPPSRLLSGFTNLCPKYVLKWALGNRNLHKYLNIIISNSGAFVSRGIIILWPTSAKKAFLINSMKAFEFCRLLWVFFTHCTRKKTCVHLINSNSFLLSELKVVTVRIGYRVTGYNDLPDIMIGLTEIKIKTSKRHSKYHYIQCVSAVVIYRI